jgi:Peptidase family M1 domain
MRLLLFFTFIASSLLSFSQEEKPYFQQEVNYKIDVKLDDKKHQIDATESIEYINKSPNTINYIYFHLWPNAYKKYNTALGKQKLEDNDTHFYFAHDSLLGFIDGLNFKINGEVAEWSYTPEDEDICIVYLNEPLLSGETIEISTPFSVKLPKGVFSRLGHINQSYQITQWYPKPAVYDKDGWHQMPYLDQGEFYSEYGTFDVSITLPKNYVVGATGDLVNGETELAWLNEKAEETSKIDIETLDFDDMSFPPSSHETKTLKYHQENVHDFAWFADKRYHVLKGEVELPHSKRKVTTWTMFTNNEAYLWENSIEYMNDAIYYYSLWNGDYPYNHATAVDGALSAGGGMEYPNVTVIGESGDDFGLETVIMHEVGHNWFYGILGSNERDHGWMDEGLNSMNENRYIETKYPSRKLLGDSTTIEKSPLHIFDVTQYKHKASYELAYLANATRNLDQPIEELSAEYTSLNYGGIVYSKTALVFDYLMAYLGEKLYDKCMQRYFNEWKFKHPQPEDLQHIFEEETSKDLSWFFNGLIKTTNKVDYKLARSKKDTANPENILLKIRNKGKIHGPFSISGVKDGQIIKTQWYEPIENKSFVTFKKGDYDNYRIDAELNIPEVKRKNNTLKSKGLFKKMEPLRLQLLGSIENLDRTQLFFSPIAGWNNNDDFMAGLAFYNFTVPYKKFEYVVAPMYGFGSENITGYFSSFYHIMPNNVFQDIRIGGYASSFSYLSFEKLNTSKQALSYYKFVPKVTFAFKKKRARQFTSIYIDYEFNNIFEEQAIFSQNSNERGQFRISTTDFVVNNFTIGMKSKHPINPFLVTANFQQHKDFLKLNLTANYRFSYKKPGTGLDVRFFVGRFLINDDEEANSRFNFNLSGGEGSDYLYNEIFLGRNSTEGILNQQFSVTDGGFKNLAIPESDDQFMTANRWLNAINLKSNLFTKHISIYADFGFAGALTRDTDNNEIDQVSDVAYDFGAALNIIPNIFEIYFPFVMSSDLNQLKYAEKIRFTLNINTLNPFKMIREFDL